jgi:hypothetical protein
MILGRASRRLLCFTSSLRVLSRNRRATLYRSGDLAQWLRSKKAANRGYAPDAADVFNAPNIKANNAFMPAPLNPQTPFNKGDLARPLNIMYRNYAQLSECHVGSASHTQLTVRARAPHNLHYIKWPQPPPRGSRACASAQAVIYKSLRSPPSRPTVHPRGVPQEVCVSAVSRSVCHRAQPIKVRSCKHDAGATLTSLRAVPSSND